jgi:hypothetical protein
MVGRAERRLAERGDWGTIEYVVLRNGQCPSQEFVNSLDASDQAKLARLFNKMAMVGRIFNEQKFKKESGEIYGFKSFQVRIGCFRVGSAWLLTHGFRKKKDHWPKSELERANAIRTEYLQDHQEENG